MLYTERILTVVVPFCACVPRASKMDKPRYAKVGLPDYRFAYTSYTAQRLH